MADLPPKPPANLKSSSTEDVTKRSTEPKPGHSHSNSSLSLTSTGADMESKMFTPETHLARSKGENIMVFVRMRPMNNFERSKHALSAVDCPGTREIVVRDRNLGGTQKTFTYDRVFGPNSKQIDVYKAVVSPLLEEVLMGYNCTVFAYGQTGTGKTFTMEGERVGTDFSWETDPLAGIVPRAMSQLFDELRITNSEFTVRVSLLEMYNEEVYDLLSPCDESSKPRTVRLYEDSSKKGSVTIQNLEEVIVHSKHDVYAIMERGSQIRKTASTLLNANSSRSHTVFTVTVHIKESSLIGEDLLKIGKLHLVDLAGSENIGRSGAVDKRAREAGNINQSLLTLGRVITALVEKAPHVPYRESKLTRLLQDSLGGRTKTSIIATISPASTNLEETMSTLDYAFRAKNIQNKPEVNQKLTKKAMLREYTEEIERLRKDLVAAREKNGVYVDKDNYDEMVRRIESQDQDLSDKIQCTKHLEDQILAKDVELKDVRGVLEETKDDLAAANALISGLKTEISSLAAKLTELSTQKEEMEHLVDVRTQNETKLRNEATALLHTAADSTVKLDSLYTKLDRKKSVEASNYEAGTRFRNSFDSDLKLLASHVKMLQTQHAEFCGSQRLTIDEYMSKLKLMKDDISQHCTTVSDTLEDYHQQIFKGSGQLNEFWDSTYLLDMPTGATPPRKAYDFPRNLTTTSPHHRILARFRARAQDIPESDSDRDVNDEDSSSLSLSDTSGGSLTSSKSDNTAADLKENKAPVPVENRSELSSPEDLSSSAKNAKIDSLPSMPSTNDFDKPEFFKPLSDCTKLETKHVGGKKPTGQPIKRKNAEARKGKKVLQTPNL